MKKLSLLFSILILVCSLIVGLIANRFAFLFSLSSGTPIERINVVFSALSDSLLQHPFFVSVDKVHLFSMLSGIFIVWLFFLYQLSFSKNYMKGQEHGSSKWGNNKDIKPLRSSCSDMNIPLSATEQITLGKAKNFEADRNKNVLVIGGSGSGKTYSIIKPSLMQLHSSYVITDPKGTILPDTGYLFANNNYQIRTFNTIDFSKSLHYNPLAYIRNEKDILKVVNVLMENTSGDGNQSGDKFWKDSERLLYTALIAYLWYEAPPEDCNIPSMIDMLESCEVHEDDENFKNALDILFEELEQEKPNCLAVKQYKKFKLAAGKTLKSILISCAARLAPFDISELREIMQYDELELDQIGDHKTAFFVIMSDTDSTYSFLIAMIMYQMFNLLCEKADNEYGGKLPFHVRCLLDEFANIGKIPDFEKLISTIRSREISATIILQSLTQISAVYKDNAETIIDCCDTVVFLGGKSTKTTKQLSEMIGKTTIDTQNVNETKGQNGNYSLNNGIIGRDLIDPSEISRLKRKECLVLITGLPPFKSHKYPTNKHKRFHQIADGGASIFDIREYISELDSHFLDTVSEVSVIDISQLIPKENIDEERGLF